MPAQIPDEIKPGFDGLGFTKYQNVFGVNILATEGVDDDSMLHAAKIMASYLDNDNDGVVDDEAVRDKLYKKHASLVIFKDQEEADETFPPPLMNLKGWMR